MRIEPSMRCIGTCPRGLTRKSMNRPGFRAGCLSACTMGQNHPGYSEPRNTQIARTIPRYDVNMGEAAFENRRARSMGRYPLCYTTAQNERPRAGTHERSEPRNLRSDRGHHHGDS